MLFYLASLFMLFFLYLPTSTVENHWAISILPLMVWPILFQTPQNLQLKVVMISIWVIFLIYKHAHQFADPILDIASLNHASCCSCILPPQQNFLNKIIAPDHYLLSLTYQNDSRIIPLNFYIIPTHWPGNIKHKLIRKLTILLFITLIIFIQGSLHVETLLSLFL